MAEIEIIPNKNEDDIQKPKKPKEEIPYQDLVSEDDIPPVFNDNNFELSQTKNSFTDWLKQNKTLVGVIATIVVLLLGFVATQAFQRDSTPTIVVQNFDDCVANGGRVLENTSPRECYFRQVQFIEEVKSVPELKPEPKPEPEVQKPKIEIKQYTHPTFPKLRIDYPSDWKLTEDNTQTGTTILFQKESITLSYNIVLVDVFGDQGGVCTNDTTRFLKLKDSDWFRIRLNNGERIYSQNIILKSQGQPPENLDDFEMPNPAVLALEWVEILVLPNGVFEACLIGMNNLAGITETEIPSSVSTNTGKKSGLISIKISGINDNNREILAEADAIVASTII